MQRFLSIAAAAAVAAGLSLGSPAFARSSMSMSKPTCAAGDTVVWVNTKSKVYYMPGASYYGKTMHGKYVCASAAASMGAHAAKGGMMSDSNGSSMSGHKMHHAMHKDTMHGGSMGSGSMGAGSMGSGSMGSGKMGSGSMGSGSTGSGSMGSGRMGSGSTASSAPVDSHGMVTPAPGASPAIQVSPNPNFTASPSAH